MRANADCMAEDSQLVLLMASCGPCGFAVNCNHSHDFSYSQVCLFSDTGQHFCSGARAQ
jgi:hypothetical protein